MKTVYLFDSNGVYVEKWNAQESPLEPGVYIEPVNSTPISPPTIAANEAAVFANGAWSLVPNFRGQTWFDQTTGFAVEITSVGQPPANLAPTAPLPTVTPLAAFQQSALSALSATDTTFDRIQEAITLGLTTAADPSVIAWIEYRKALRAEIKAPAVGTLPIKPSTYPAGT
jgi:hypothetical protein